MLAQTCSKASQHFFISLERGDIFAFPTTSRHVNKTTRTSSFPTSCVHKPALKKSQHFCVSLKRRGIFAFPTTSRHFNETTRTSSFPTSCVHKPALKRRDSFAFPNHNDFFSSFGLKNQEKSFSRVSVCMVCLGNFKWPEIQVWNIRHKIYYGDLRVKLEMARFGRKIVIHPLSHTKARGKSSAASICSASVPKVKLSQHISCLDRHPTERKMPGQSYRPSLQSQCGARRWTLVFRISVRKTGGVDFPDRFACKFIMQTPGAPAL